MLEGMNVSVQAASLTIDYPVALGNNVMPPDISTTPRSTPAGASIAGMPAD